MKKRYIILMCFILLFMIGCNQEEAVGDILIEKEEYLMSTTKELDILKYHMTIKSINEGMEYNNTIFSFLVNNEDGMYICNYNRVTNNINIDNYIESITINDKEYKYYINNDTINLIYMIDDNYYLDLSIKAINNDTVSENIDNLLELFEFKIEEK